MIGREHCDIRWRSPMGQCGADHHDHGDRLNEFARRCGQQFRSTSAFVTEISEVRSSPRKLTYQLRAAAGIGFRPNSRSARAGALIGAIGCCSATMRDSPGARLARVASDMSSAPQLERMTPNLEPT